MTFVERSSESSGSLERIVGESDVIANREALFAVGERAAEYIRCARAENTLKAYRSDWRDFATWCGQHGRESLPASADTVALYLTMLAEVRKCSTLQRRISAIAQVHQAAGQLSPTYEAKVRAIWSGIRRAKGTRQVGKAPTLTADIRNMVEAMPDTLAGLRDRALILIGFAGAFRRSELVALLWEDLQISTEGITITIRRGKTDQEGEGRKLGIPYGSRPATCPVRAMQAWLKASGIESGHLFRAINKGGGIAPAGLSDKAVALIVKRAAEAAGMDASLYAGHSLRAGLATSAAQAGVSERAIMKQTGHTSVNTVRRYIRDGSLFRENAAAEVGL